jgi:hypothetical protein
MRRHREEPYWAATPDKPSCCIPGCLEEPVAEVDRHSYARLLERLRIPASVRTTARRHRLYVCRAHIDDQRLTGIQWQLLMFSAALLDP